MRQTNRRRSPARAPVPVRKVLSGMLRGLSVMSVIGLFAVAGWWFNQALVVKSWQISGLPESLENTMDERLQELQPLDLVHAWPASLRRHLLSTMPDLAEVNIARRLPDRLEIMATVRMPVALWRNAQGTVQLVDGKGAAYRPLRAGEMLDLPLLRVEADELDVGIALLLKLKQVDSASYARLSEWIGEDDGWKLNFDRGRCWLLPRGTFAAQRMEQVIALTQDSRWKNGDWRIDVRATTRWFIRKSKLGGMV